MRLLVLAAALLVPAAAWAQAEPAAPPVAETAYAFGETGLQVTLPPGWSGPSAADESRLPAHAVYTFANEVPGPLAGATLRIERVVGLNPVEQELWGQGRSTRGYGDARPVGPAAAPLPGLALEVAAGGRAGVIVFFQRGGAFWVAKAEAPAGVWAARPGDVAAVLASVEVL